MCQNTSPVGKLTTGEQKGKGMNECTVCMTTEHARQLFNCIRDWKLKGTNQAIHV